MAQWLLCNLKTGFIFYIQGHELRCSDVFTVKVKVQLNSSPQPQPQHAQSNRLGLNLILGLVEVEE